MYAININTDAIVVFAARLEEASKTALPVVVRRTLNATGLDVKRVTMPAQSDAAFIKRKPTFWPATSSVDLAKGLDINHMAATVGFVAPASAKESGHATQDLEEQEHGGDIDKRAFIPLKAGRNGKGNVKEALTMEKIKSHIIDSNKERGKNDGEKFIKAAIKAGYPNGFVIGSGRNARGNRALLRILAIHRLKAGEGQKGGKYAGEQHASFSGNMVVKTEQIYSVRGGRKAHVKATHFMQKASEESAKKMPRIFAEYSQAWFDKIKY